MKLNVIGGVFAVLAVASNRRMTWASAALALISNWSQKSDRL